MFAVMEIYIFGMFGHIHVHGGGCRHGHGGGARHVDPVHVELDGAKLGLGRGVRHPRLDCALLPGHRGGEQVGGRGDGAARHGDGDGARRGGHRGLVPQLGLGLLVAALGLLVAEGGHAGVLGAEGGGGEGVRLGVAKPGPDLGQQQLQHQHNNNNNMIKITFHEVKLQILINEN